MTKPTSEEAVPRRGSTKTDEPKTYYNPETARRRYLRRQLPAAYKKVEMLEKEARRYGLHELIKPTVRIIHDN